MVIDIHKNQLQIGDPVYFTKYGEDTIRDGTVHKIDSRNIVIAYQSWNNSTAYCRMGIHRAKDRVVAKR